METLKTKIEKLSSRQTFLKDQRKTVRLEGKRVMKPWEAALEHSINRDKLRLMYAAHGLLLGRLFSEIENHYKEESHPLLQYENSIHKIVSEHESEYEKAVYTSE